MRERPVKLITTVCFVGYLPLAPGTWGSLAGALIFLLAARYNVYASMAMFAILFFLGLYAAGKAEDIFGKKDDGRIVIDEACGMLFLFLLIPANKGYLIAGFILYRIFDVLKPYPAKKLEKLPRSWGVMADDILAALYAFIIINAYIIVRGLFYREL